MCAYKVYWTDGILDIEFYLKDKDTVLREFWTYKGFSSKVWVKEGKFSVSYFLLMIKCFKAFYYSDPNSN